MMNDERIRGRTKMHFIGMRGLSGKSGTIILFIFQILVLYIIRFSIFQVMSQQEPQPQPQPSEIEQPLPPQPTQQPDPSLAHSDPANPPQPEPEAGNLEAQNAPNGDAEVNKDLEADVQVAGGEEQPEAPEKQESGGEEKKEKSEKEKGANQNQEKEEDEPGKSVRRGSSNEIQESREQENENDTSQVPTGGGKRCFNKLCSSKKIYKKIRSKVQSARYRFLCKNCYENYVNNNFCQFCEQIYSNVDEDQDQDKWVGCDQCERWNHVECERKFRNPNYTLSRDTDVPYECLACVKKHKNNSVQTELIKKKAPVDREAEQNRVRSTKIEINRDERIPIFHKKPEPFPCLEPFLQGFNFRLWLNESMIRDDLENLRSLARRPNGQQQPKKTKKVKLD